MWCFVLLATCSMRGVVADVAEQLPTASYERKCLRALKPQNLTRKLSATRSMRAVVVDEADQLLAGGLQERLPARQPINL